MTEMLQTIDIPVTLFQQVCRIVYDSGTNEGVLVDPGGEAGRIIGVLQEKQIKCRGMWLTHSHLDHCGAVAELREKTGIKLFAHPAEKELRMSVLFYASMFGVPPDSMRKCPEPDILLNGGESLSVGSHNFEVLFTPGHSPGHLCYYSREDKLLLSGDLLFAGSVGRTDLPEGSHEVLMSSIRHTILRLPDDTVVLPGHGHSTTVGEERRSNPFLHDLVSDEH